MVGTHEFNWAAGPRIVFGEGSLDKLPALCKGYGTQLLVVTGGASFINGPFWQSLQRQLSDASLSLYHVTVPREPYPQLIDEIVSSHKEAGIQVVVAIGGGSVLDAGKAISAMLKHPKGVKNYLEGVGEDLPTGDKVPFIAAPTTSGTGSEATKNAVLSEVGPQGFKKSLRHDNFVPDIALVDPALMLSCPPALTASSGMDAFTQLFEAYISNKASSLSDALAWEGLLYIAQSLETAFSDGTNLTARNHMAYASLLSGISLANAGLGVVHGFASSVGAKVDIPHGALCGTLMGATNRVTLKKLLDVDPYSAVVKKYAAVGKLFADEENRYGIYYAHHLVEVIEELTHQFSLPSLSGYGVTKEQVSEIVQHTSQKNHPVELSPSEMESILIQRL